MNTIEKLNIGIVGACGRGANFQAVCDAVKGVEHVGRLVHTPPQGTSCFGIEKGK